MQDNPDLSINRNKMRNSFLSRVLSPWTFLILLVAAAAFFYFSSADEEETHEPMQRPPAAVEVAPVAGITLADTIRAVGTLRPVKQVEIKPEAEGRIKAIHFQEGGFVSRNKLLFEIEEQKHLHRMTASDAALEQARTSLENIRRNYERSKNLYQQNLISEDDFDRIKTEMASASSEVRRLTAQLQLAREDLDDTLIRAPFSGFISRRLVDQGAYVSVGQLLATMQQTDPLEISFKVPERHAAVVSLGQKVIVNVAAHPDEKFTGAVSFVSPSIEESTRSFEVKASIDNPANKLKPGSFAGVMLILGYRDDTMVIPERSLVSTRDGYLVFILDGERQKAQSRPVKTGSRRPGIVEVLDGLSPDDIVVVSGHMNLNDGMAVRIVQESGPDWARDEDVRNVSAEPVSDSGAF